MLELLISADGKVEQAAVVEGLGSGLDEAARAAALKFQFVPARQDGENRAARIRYAYEFRLPPLASPAASVAASEGAQPAATSSPAAPTAAGDTVRASTSQEAAHEVVVRGIGSAERKKRSSAAVTVVELEHARRESADVGEVLARTEGIAVQRFGGLGSRARFSLAGFDEGQVRFFIDGVPLEYSGYSFGLQNVPVTFAERIDVYKGVVPVALGADSLGGAFDLVTDRKVSGTHASASYQGGSFDTHRLAAGARHLDSSTGLFFKGEAFLDRSENDYPIDVVVADRTGEIRNATVRRFHDRYRARGGNLELGLVDRGWARRLLVRGFATNYRKELQHNLVMSVPFGEAQYGGSSYGGSVRYEQSFGRGLSGSFVTGYVYDRTNVLDKAACTYDWFGQCIVPKVRPGELAEQASDRSIWDHTGYLRWNLALVLPPHQQLRLAIAPTHFSRRGEERELAAGAIDRLGARRDLLKWVNGLEHTLELFDRDLENSAFVKAYLNAARADEVLTSAVTIHRRYQKLHWGAGDGLRYRLTDWAYAKASYEYAIRLPEPVEVFGNGVLIAESLELEPERSHNLNLSLLVSELETVTGNFEGSLTGFYREADNLIVLLGLEGIFTYENVYAARSVGGEAALTWVSPDEHVELGGNATYQDFRNVSSQGTFGQFEGDRIPNKPYLFANGHVRLQRRALAAPRDELALTWYSRYVHDFYRSWESPGRRDTKQTVDAQLLHTAVLSYVTRNHGSRELSFSAELQNLTNAKSFDVYGLQKPGRQVFFKTVLTY